MDRKKPEQITIAEELHVCPECGYEDGFHTSFVRQTKEKCKIILICPSCHARFDPNWMINIRPVRTPDCIYSGRRKSFNIEISVTQQTSAQPN